MIWAIFAIVLLAAAAEGVFVYACYSPSSTFYRPVLLRGPGEGQSIALTFDDGPAPHFTDKILDILREKKVPATFFVCGRNVDRHPEIARRIVQEGHQLGNHTYSHSSLFLRSAGRVAEEIDRAQESIQKASGFCPTIFRPPYGARTPGLMDVLSARGLKLVMWSAMGYDWKLSKERIVQSVLKTLKPGAIVLLHDGKGTDDSGQIDRRNTLEALPEIIDQARESGFNFVPLTEFL
jgi:peptidoglycan-N-acetylglucosamine deacetylase